MAVVVATIAMPLLPGNGTTSAASAVDGYIFGRGVDDAVWYRPFDQETGWGAWTSLGGVATGQPAALQYPDGRVAVFVRGQDGALWYRETPDGVNWLAWQSLGGQLLGDPAVAARSNGAQLPGVYNLFVFVTGLDRRVYVRLGRAATGDWTAWLGPGPETYAGPLAASDWGTGAIAVGVGDAGDAISMFADSSGDVLSSGSWGGSLAVSEILIDSVIGARAVDDQLVFWNGGPWEPRGGIITDGPSRGPGGDDLVLARGVDGAVWSHGCCGQGWRSLGGQVLEGPAFREGLVGGVLAARGVDSAVWVRMVNANDSSLVDWQPLGGLLTGRPVVLVL